MLSSYMRKRLKANRLLALVLSGIVVVSIGCGIFKEKTVSEPETIKIEENKAGGQTANGNSAGNGDSTDNAGDGFIQDFINPV